MPATNLEGFEFKEESISIYIKYTHLPAEQFATLLYATNAIVENLKQIFPTGGLEKLLSPPIRLPLSFIDDSELSLISVQTGNSIEYRLAFRKGKPRIRFLQKEQVFEITLPHWTALLVVACGILACGAMTYEKILQIENLRLENEKIRMELKSMNLKQLTDNSNPVVNSLNINVNQFHQQINQDNIRQVVINNVVVKDGKGDEKK
jgi:hypothetical protein